MLCGLLDNFCQLMESLVVAEEVGSGACLSKLTNPDVWWPRVVSNHYWLNEQVRISLEIIDQNIQSTRLWIPIFNDVWSSSAFKEQMSLRFERLDLELAAGFLQGKSSVQILC